MLFRYPGSKSKISEFIVDRILCYYDIHGYDMEYREPFFGSGSVGMSLMEQRGQLKNIWINDYDVGIASTWSAVISNPDELCTKTAEFIPTTEDFFSFKETLLHCPRKIDVDIGFKKMAIHQISFSGLGTMSGGPLGGKSQASAYGIACRWKPLHMQAKIRKANRILSYRNIRNGQCTFYDYSELLKGDGNFFCYLDPPYYEMGPDLYQCSFTRAKHRKLAELLKTLEQPWLLSYDDSPYIRKIYDWAEVGELSITYSVNTSGTPKSRNKKELLITSPKFKTLLDDPNREVDLFA